MLRIVGIQRSTVPEQEFLLLQNHGNLRVSLRGHAVIADVALGGPIGSLGHAFDDDENVPPGQYVVLFSGEGQSRWVKTKDGGIAYYAYMGRRASVWSDLEGPIHVLHVQHSFVERGPALLLR